MEMCQSITSMRCCFSLSKLKQTVSHCCYTTAFISRYNAFYTLINIDEFRKKESQCQVESIQQVRPVLSFLNVSYACHSWARVD